MKYLDRYLIGSFVLWLVAMVIYSNYYDILIPGITQGSYRVVIGQLFVVPAFLLSVGQILIGAFMIFASVALFKGKEQETKSVFIATVMVLIFSLTYVIFPMFGPFYFIVFATSIAPPGVLLIEVVWAVVFMAAATLLIHKLEKMPLRYAFFTAGITGIFMVVAAS